jgi:hypothetical protein
VDYCDFSLEDLADFEHNKNATEIHLRWSDYPPVKEALPILEKCTHLRRLTLKSGKRLLLPPLEELCDFIMKLKHLTFLHIIYRDIPNCDHFKSLVDKVKEFVSPRRPSFKFYVSCCKMFHESRVSRTTTL